MIGSILKHYIYDTALGILFDNIAVNFAVVKFRHIEPSQLSVGDRVKVETSGTWFSGIVEELGETKILLGNLDSNTNIPVSFQHVWFFKSMHDWYVFR